MSAARSEARIQDLEGPVALALRSALPSVSELTVAAVMGEVPGYGDSLSNDLGVNIQNAVRMALGGFLDLAVQPSTADPGSPLGPALDAAYALGRGEARSGRTMDALLSAYRIGARVAWREMAAISLATGLPPQSLADFAELVFAYIDELSGASVAGHSDELATSGRVRERYLELLARALVDGADPDVLVAAAERAGWTPPATLVCVLIPATGFERVPAGLPAATLVLETGGENTVLLVPGTDRARLVSTFGARPASVGPARPWQQVQASYLRARRTAELGLPGTVDSDQHLAALVLTADPESLADLRAQALAPLADLRPDAATKLEQTLRSWLLHHGRREEIAADLFVHPQTVRYRMGQLRELYGDQLTDPAAVLRLTVALGLTR